MNSSKLARRAYAMASLSAGICDPGRGHQASYSTVGTVQPQAIAVSKGFVLLLSIAGFGTASHLLRFFI
jgi:hypothetical protein